MAQLAYTDIKRNVRTILDYNKTSEGIQGLQDDFGTLDIDTMIQDSISPALMQLMMMAPLEIVEQKVSEQEVSVSSSGLTPVEMTLPEDYLRFISCRLTSWDIPVTTLTSPGSREHMRQHGEVQGLKATGKKPIAVLNYAEADGHKRLIMYNGVKGDTKATCHYVGMPRDNGTEITLGTRLHTPLYYIVAAIVCEILKDTQKSQYLMQTARSLLTSLEGALEQTIQTNTQ